MSKDRGIYAIYFSIGFLAVIAAVALAISLQPTPKYVPPPPYAPLTLEVTLDEGDVSLAGGLLPVTVNICSTSTEQLLVSGVSTYVENLTGDDPAARATSLPGLSASIVFAPDSCQTLGRALPLSERMTTGSFYLNLIVSVVAPSGETQFINQRTPAFKVID